MIDRLGEWFEPGPLFWPLCVVFLALIPLVWWRARGASARPTMRFSSVEGAAALGSSWVIRTGFVLPLLRTLALLALIFALARPQSGGEVIDTRRGIAIEMVLDVSGSMSEPDFRIDGQAARRLDAVKRVFREFVLGADGLSGRPNDMIGMTTFAMYADARCPLTLDHANLVNLLDQTEIPGWVDGVDRYRHPEADNTSLGDAIVLATDELRRAGEQARAGVLGAEAARSLVMILLTDGANNPPPQHKGTAPDPVESARLAARASGMGPQGGFFTRPTAQVDEPTLRRIAAETGGTYFRATDTKSLMTIYDEIDKLERYATGERSYQDNTRAANVAMLIAMGLLAGEVLLVNTRYRRIP
jgi:Ca-activated chloride channel family protein